MRWFIDIAIALGTGALLFFAGNYYDNNIADKVSKQRRLLLKILSFVKSKDSRIAITYGCVTPLGDSDAFMLEQGDFSAIIKSRDIINIAFPTIRQDFLSSVDLFPNLLKYDNVFSISGPRWNTITAKIMGDLGCPVEFVAEKRMVKVTNKTTMKSVEYETVKKAGELATECYGIILSGNVERPGFQNQKVVVCAGRTTLSTYSCISYLNHLSNSKNEVKKLLSRGIRGDNNWCVLLRTRRSPSTVQGTNLPLHDVDVTFDVVQIFHHDDFLAPYQLTWNHANNCESYPYSIAPTIELYQAVTLSGNPQ